MTPTGLLPGGPAPAVPLSAAVIWSELSGPKATMRLLLPDGTFGFGQVTLDTASTFGNPQVMADTAGSIFGAWLIGGVSDLKVQKLNAAGAAQWTANGLLVNSAKGAASVWMICSDGTGGLYAVWNHGPANPGGISVVRVGSGGTFPSGWAIDGLTLRATSVSPNSRLQINPDGYGGAFVVWNDRRTVFDEIYIQRVSSAGAALWTADGVPLTSASIALDSSDLSALVADGSGGVFVAWEQGTNIYAQRVFSSGSVAWGAGGVLIGAGSLPGMVSDGSDGCIISYFSGGAHKAQRINDSGVLQWAAGGVSVIPSSSTGTGHKRIVSDMSGGAILVGTVGSGATIRAQRVNGSGVLQWTAGGVIVAPSATSDRADPNVAPDGIGGAIVVWDEGQVDVGGDVYAQRVNVSGVLQWAAGGVIVASGTNDQMDPNIATADLSVLYGSNPPLTATWGAKGRQLEEFISPAVTDGIPSVCALVTKETIESGLDDGRFGQLWWRDQVVSVNRTIGSEYSSALYPAPGVASNYRVVPLWYESGDGSVTRGVSEFARRFMLSGSRRFLKVGNWWYFPNLHGTPCRWNGGVASASGVDRLIPSGPLPPTHAGVLERGNVVIGGAANTATVRPDGDISAGTFLNQASSGANLYQSIDETVADDVDYIQSAVNSNTSAEVTLGDLGFVPAADSTVTVNFRARRDTGASLGLLTVYLVEGATIRASGAFSIAVLTSTPMWHSFSLSDAEITSITDWNNLRLRFATSGASGGYYAQVSYAALSYTPSGTLAEGSWRGSDRFLYSVAYRFEDGSVWMPCTPRLPGPDLPGGFNMFTVDANNPTAQYDFIKWKNRPVAVQGAVSHLLLRTPKIDSTEEGSELKLNPYDLRVVWESTDNEGTEYIDYQADDFGLAEDPAGAFIRYDHLMPPRARYIAGGDMRIVHAYGGRNPCAVIIAPVGRTADYDLNVNDAAAAAYTANGSYMRVRYSASAGTFLDLAQSDGTTVSDLLSIDLAAYNTLQKLVDRINATSCATNDQQWRAQLCPGANPAAPSATCLTPHTRKLSAGTVTAAASTLITRAAGGLSIIAVGTYVTGTGIPADTYVTRIDSDTQLVMSAAATAANADTIEFETRTGDQLSASVYTYQRVIANSLPGFLYFNAAYLNTDPIDKSSVWMTVASPGSMKSAANSFSGKNSNRFKPPNDAGISMGGAAVDQGFVLPFSLGVYALRNTRDNTSGIDEDYKLIELNGTRGCIAWNTVTPGARFVPYLTADGLCCADLEREYLISEDPFLHSPARGSLQYEIAQSIAAAGMDDDNSYAIARVMRSAIWLNYRGTEDASHPNHQLVLDFSSGYVSNGLEALFRRPGEPWGWSTPLVRNLTAMCEGRRDDGAHLYGWNDLNNGATGDGRIDEFEVGDTDNGVEINGETPFPWERIGKHKLSAQEIIVEHVAPAGAVVYLDFYRSYENSLSTLTLSTTALVVGREVKLLPQSARAVTAACRVVYRQTEGPAAELRALTLRAKAVPSYT